MKILKQRIEDKIIRYEDIEADNRSFGVDTRNTEGFIEGLKWALEQVEIEEQRIKKRILFLEKGIKPNPFPLSVNAEYWNFEIEILKWVLQQE